MIDILKINIRFSGENFSPALFQQKISINLSTFYEKGDKMRTGDHLYQQGSCTLKSAPDEHLLDFLKRIKTYEPILKELEVTEIMLNLSYYYTDQCNLAIGKKELKIIAKLNMKVWLNCYENKKRIKKQLVSLSRSYYENQINFLAQQLLQARKDANLSLAQVADHDFISEKELEKLEKGSQQVEFLLLKELAKLYKKPLEFFYE